MCSQPATTAHTPTLPTPADADVVTMEPLADADADITLSATEESVSEDSVVSVVSVVSELEDTRRQLPR